MVAGRREAEHRVHVRADRSGVADSLTVFEGAARGGLPASQVRFNLDQDDRPHVRQADVGRRATRTRYPSLDFRTPSTVPALEESLDDPGMSSVVEHRGRARVDGDPQVGSKGDRRSPPDLQADRCVSSLQLRDDGLADSNDLCNGRLRDVQSESELAQLLAEPVRIETG
jgi:hypothetical protein